MKKTTLTFILSILLGVFVNAQAPQSFNYQAVLRDASGKVLADQDATIGVAILQGNISGAEIFSESHNVTTNSFGLANLQIGAVNPSAFEVIDWAAGPYFIQISVDGTIMGTSQLLSVPYALFAGSVANNSQDDDNDPTNEIQDISLNNNQLSISKGSTIDLSVLQDGTGTDNQKLQVNNERFLKITNGNNVELPFLLSETDGDTTNEIQTISRSGLMVILNKNGGTFQDSVLTENDVDNMVANNGFQRTADDGDIDDTNEIQTVSRSGLTVTLNKNGGTFQDSVLTETDVDNMVSNNGFQRTADDGDIDDTNEIQILSISHDTIYLSNGGFVKLPKNDSIYIADSTYIKSGVRDWNNSLAKNITKADTTRWGKSRWLVQNDDIYYTSGNVGIGISTPEDIGSAPLNVEGGILYKGGVSGGVEAGKLFYDPTGNGTFKYYDNTNTEQILGTGTINYTGTLWSSVSGDLSSNSDVICNGSLAVGGDAVAGENFGFSTILLKENNLRIRFDDTSSSSGFPNNDWQLTANESTSGGANYFAIEDITGATIPFKVMAGAKTNALYVGSNSKIGINTNSPVLDIHIHSGDTPGIRLEQDNSSGWAPQTWDVAGNEANFFIRDATNSSRLPFRIRSGAPTSSIDISSSGNVGIGIQNPTQKLDIDGAMHLKPTSQPISSTAGDIYFDSSSNKLRCFDGAEWHDLW